MKKGRFTIPTDESFIEGTKIIAEKWGADEVKWIKNKNKVAIYAARGNK